MIAHVITGETSPVRLGILKFYAKREVAILRLLYWMLNTRMINYWPVKQLVYWTLVVPTAKWAITGMPVSPDDLEGFVRVLNPTRVAVGPCRCRLAHQACDHPLETDIVIKQGFGIWTDLFPEDYREISVDEAIELCRKLHGQGLSQITYRFMDFGTNENYFVICNCCKDGCMPLLSLDFYGPDKYPFHKGTRRSVVDTSKCKGCGTCVEVCQFKARKIVDGIAVVGECFGCGLCASHCPNGANTMV